MVKEVELPDFDDLMSLVNDIENLTLRKAVAELELKSQEAKLIELATHDEKYFVKGKPPAMNYIDATIRHAGINGELIPLRILLANNSAELEAKKERLSILKSMIDVWRTQESSKRKTTF